MTETAALRGPSWFAPRGEKPKTPRGEKSEQETRARIMHHMLSNTKGARLVVDDGLQH